MNPEMSSSYSRVKSGIFAMAFLEISTISILVIGECLRSLYSLIYFQQIVPYDSEGSMKTVYLHLMKYIPIILIATIGNYGALLYGIIKKKTAFFLPYMALKLIKIILIIYLLYSAICFEYTPIDYEESYFVVISFYIIAAVEGLFIYTWRFVYRYYLLLQIVPIK